MNCKKNSQYRWLTHHSALQECRSQKGERVKCRRLFPDQGRKVCCLIIMRKGKDFLLKLLECQDGAPIEQYFPKAAFFKDTQVHFWHLSRAPSFICTPKYLSAHMVCNGSLGLATPSTDIRAISGTRLFLCCATHIKNGTKTKSLECAFPKADQGCVHLCSAVSFSPLTLRKILRDLLKALSSQIRSFFKRLCLQILPKKH